MSDRATCWSITINNPTKSDDECVALVRQRSGWAVYGQKEVGEEGTPHYQLMITTPQVRFSAIKKAFPRGHIEIARDRQALTKYVNKEATRVGELPKDNSYPSMSQMWDSFAQFADDNYKKYGSHYDWSQDKALTVFDAFIRYEIENGKFVETMAVNPQIRSIVKNYISSIFCRSIRRQTDRQTAEKEVASVEINDEGQEGCSQASSDGTTEDSSVSESSSQASGC